MSSSPRYYLIADSRRTFGRILPAYLGDKFGVFNAMIVNTAFAGVVTLALWIPASTNAPIIVYAALYGFTSGCTLSIIPAMVATLSDVRDLGVRTGSLYAISSIGVLIGSPIAGAIVNAEHGGYSGLKIFCGVFLLAGTMFAIFSRTTQSGFKLMKKV